MTKFHDEEVRPVEQEMKSENKMMELAAKIRSLTYGMCRVGPGPYGFGVYNTNPARIGMVISIDPDPYSHVFPRTEENEMHRVAVKMFLKGEKDEMISMEMAGRFQQDCDPATRTIAKAFLKISTEPFQISTQECDEAFDMMAQREMHGLDTGLTRIEARQLMKLKWYKGKTPQEIVSFQLFQTRICLPFRKYQKAMETVLGRPVQIQEFKDIPLLREEYRRNRFFRFSPKKAKNQKRKPSRQADAR